MLEVFWASGSAPAWRVLLTLTVKGIPWESRRIHLTRREHKRPEYLSINPRGKVPSIREGDFTLHESVAIMAYLERRFPSPTLFGATPEEHGSIHRLIVEHESYFWPAMTRVVRPILYGGPGATAGKEGDMKAARAALREEIGSLEAVLAERHWLAGERVSAADLAIYPGLMVLWRAAARPSAARFELGLTPEEGRFPALRAWCARVETLPGYESTYPPTWREG
ncbi:Glutathione S-transferase [Minicystis rosea]|nr:Glutathione S-transferase [Minicystis rosea]